MSEFRTRILLPVSIPMVAAAFIFVLVFSFSRILLAIPEMGSTTTALLMAAEILGVSAVLSAATRIKAAQRAVLLVTGLALVGGGAAAASLGVRKIERHGIELAISARDIKFNLATLSFPADAEVSLKFANADVGVPHDVSISKDEKQTDVVFKGETFPGVATRAYKVPGLAGGEYYFFCSVHPTLMTGALLVGEGAAVPTASPSAPPTPSPTVVVVTPPPSPSPTSAAAPTETTIVASGIQFVTTEITLAANAQDTIVLDNRDTAPHNVVITTERGGGGQRIFREETFSGPAQRTRRFQGPAPGTYYYFCEVHPNMQGTATFV
jgi:plastocyanin